MKLVALAGLAACAGFLFKATALPVSLWVMAAVFVAAMVSSVAGFAFSAICGAMLFHFVREPLHAVQIMMVCSVGGQALMVWSLRREIDWRSLLVFLTGGAIGLPLGLFILLHSRPALYLQLIGALILLYAGYMALRRQVVVRRQHALWDAVAGFLGGITGGVAACPLGASIGMACFKWLNDRQFALSVNALLVASGLSLLL